MEGALLALTVAVQSGVQQDQHRSCAHCKTRPKADERCSHYYFAGCALQVTAQKGRHNNHKSWTIVMWQRQDDRIETAVTVL